MITFLQAIAMVANLTRVQPKEDNREVIYKYQGIISEFGTGKTLILVSEHGRGAREFAVSLEDFQNWVVINYN